MSADPSLPRPDGFQPPAGSQPPWAACPPEQPSVSYAPPQVPHVQVQMPYAQPQVPYVQVPYQPAPPYQPQYPPMPYPAAPPPWAGQPGTAGYLPYNVYPGAAVDPMRRPGVLTAMCIIQLCLVGLIGLASAIVLAIPDERRGGVLFLLVTLLVAILAVVLIMLVMMGSRGSRTALVVVDGLIIVYEVAALSQGIGNMGSLLVIGIAIATIVVLFTRESSAFFAAHTLPKLSG